MDDVEIEQNRKKILQLENTMKMLQQGLDAANLTKFELVGELDGLQRDGASAEDMRQSIEDLRRIEAEIAQNTQKMQFTMNEINKMSSQVGGSNAKDPKEALENAKELAEAFSNPASFGKFLITNKTTRTILIIVIFVVGFFLIFIFSKINELVKSAGVDPNEAIQGYCTTLKGKSVGTDCFKDGFSDVDGIIKNQTDPKPTKKT